MKLVLRAILVITFTVSAAALIVVLPIQPQTKEDSKLGLTFSSRAAEYLGLDWKKTYLAMLTDLQPEVLRIPVYWNVLQPQAGEFNFSDVDFQLERVLNTDTRIILAIGHKLPRWPECHVPEWAVALTKNQLDEKIKEMIVSVVERYKNHENLLAWQVENEVLFPFGKCPAWSNNRERLKILIESVKRLDPNHQIMTSDSGELSSWFKTATLPIDSLAISLYRVVYNSKTGYAYWPTNPYFYKLHAFLIKPLVNDFIISELQMEPWGSVPVNNLSDHEAYLSFSPFDFDERIDFAKRTGASIILGWGVEWWYYMKELRSNPEYWNKAIEHFSQR